MKFVYKKAVFEIKTIIELFDVCQIENIVAGLRLLPEKIVFVGFKEAMTGKRKQDLENFLKMRGINIKLEYEIVGRYDFNMIADKLNSILDSNPDSCFDLTGGKELVLAAIGLVAGERNVPMVQFDIKKGALIPVKNSDGIIDNMNSDLTVEESVVLNGGALVRDGMPWDMTDEFKADIETLWSICRRNCRHWNRQSNVFASFEEFCGGGIYVDADLRYMRDKGADTYMNVDIIRELKDAGMISSCNIKPDRVTFRYKNQQVYRCMTKAGNILELYAYMTANEINADSPGYYGDIEIGAVVDWDGKIHNLSYSAVDTTNEIDIFLMRGMVPVFVSCKNGTVYKEALYELDTVARKIGGKYAKKVLLTTYVTSDAESRKYLLTRAEDMNIEVVEGIHNMSREDFASTLKRITK